MATSQLSQTAVGEALLSIALLPKRSQLTTSQTRTVVPGPGDHSACPETGDYGVLTCPNPLPHIAPLTTALKSAYRNTAVLATRAAAELRELLIPGGQE